MAKRRNTKIAFSLKCCISALPEFNQLFDFFNQSFWLMPHTHDAVWLLISCSQWVQPVQEKGSREHCRRWTMLHEQCTTALSSEFPISQGNAEALERWGGKTKHRLISYFLSNTSAKNYHNRSVCVKIIASQRRDVFWDTVYTVYTAACTSKLMRANHARFFTPVLLTIGNSSICDTSFHQTQTLVAHK